MRGGGRTRYSGALVRRPREGGRGQQQPAPPSCGLGGGVAPRPSAGTRASCVRADLVRKEGTAPAAGGLRTAQLNETTSRHQSPEEGFVLYLQVQVLPSHSAHACRSKWTRCGMKCGMGN